MARTAPRTISTNNLTPGALYCVRGRVGFCRITRHCTDDERIKDNDRRRIKVDKNYSNISLYDAIVLYNDPQNPTIEERYAEECLYLSKSANYPGDNFSAMNKSPNLPLVFQVSASDPNKYDQVHLEKEIAPGVDVTIVMRVFKGKGAINAGVTLERVLINELGPIRYFEGSGNNDINNQLAERGLTFNYTDAPAPQAVPQNNPVNEDYNAANDPNASEGVTFVGQMPPQQNIAPTTPAYQPAPAAPAYQGQQVYQGQQAGYAPAPAPAQTAPVSMPVPPQPAAPAAPVYQAPPAAAPVAPGNPFTTGNIGAGPERVY